MRDADQAELLQAPIEVRLTAQFYAWERWGRGWQVWPMPVALEPPFRPFLGHTAPHSLADDGRRPTFWSSFFDRLSGRAAEAAYGPEMTTWMEELESVPAPELEEDEARTAEIQVLIPEDARVTRDRAAHLLVVLAGVSAPVAFEVIGIPDGVVVQFAVAAEDRAQVCDQIRAHFPEAITNESDGFLGEHWVDKKDRHSLVVDFGLSREFMCPIEAAANFESDSLMAVVGALAGVEAGEILLLQVLFAPAAAPWAESIMRAVTDGSGGSFFPDAPDMVKLAAEKVGHPLFGAIVRVAAQSPRLGRADELARSLAAALRPFSRPESNELIPLTNDGYDSDFHADDVLHRRSRRNGMLLNAAELVSLVHLPSAAVRHPKLRREGRRTRGAPASTAGHALVLGENVHQGAVRRVSIALETRLRHMHVIGGTGTGKSTLLLSLIIQDMEQGQGLALLDPHGDLVDDVLSHVPDSRVGDVILVDPSDEDRPVGFNILQAHSELERTLLASDLVGVFRRLSTSWGDQMHSVLANAILAFLESDRGGTIADLRRFLVEPGYRMEFLSTVRDPEVRYYWTKEFPLLAGKPQAPILTRLDAFLRPRLIRAMVTARENKIDLSRVMNEGKLLLVRLAQGMIGEENAALLGSLFVAKVHQLVMGRQEQRSSERRPFFLYIDEFQHFVTPSMATLLTSGRKYGLGLVLAHQQLAQLVRQDRDVAAAVLGNAATRVVFRVGAEDAKSLAEASEFFGPRDLQNLPVGEAICRLERAECDFNLRVVPPVSVPADVADARRHLIAAESREKYGVLAPAAEPRAAASPGVVVGARESAAHAGTPLPGPGPASPAPPPPAPEAEAWAESARASAGKARPLGRGGPRHRYLQELVGRWAESKGYRATIEREVLAGAGSVDVVLERGERRIACEISVTTAAEDEVQNIQKCLAAGFEEVFAIVVERGTATGLRKSLGTSLSAGEQSRVRVVSPDEFFTTIEGSEQTPAKVETVRGYRVKVRSAEGSGDAGARQRVIADTVLSALRRMKPPNRPDS